jgi:uncharacterized paraquat-inducible protein A
MTQVKCYNVNMIDDEYQESLIECAECRRAIDEDCTMCPGCGYFLVKQDRESRSATSATGKNCFLVVAVVLILIFVLPAISRILITILSG